MNSSRENPNEGLLLSAAKKLAPLLDRIVFVGGCATGLLVTDPGAAPVRVTIDVDVIVELTSTYGFVLAEELLNHSTQERRVSTPVRATGDVDAITSSASYPAWINLEDKLRELGFREPVEEGAPRCRWVYGDLRLDLMPTDPTILGFSNRWYKSALENARWVHVGEYEIRLITAPYFLATKLEAFHDRGRNDYRISHDLEDIITVVNGRPELLEEISHSSMELRQYLSSDFRSILANPDFRDALPGHLLPDTASQEQMTIVLDRMQEIVNLI